MNMQGLGSATLFGTSTPSSSTAAAGDTSLVSSSAPAMSRAAQFLAQLQQSDPAQAKQLLTDLASKIRCEASQPGGLTPARAALADALQKAADTGDLSGLQGGGASEGGSLARGAAAYSHTMAVTQASM